MVGGVKEGELWWVYKINERIYLNKKKMHKLKKEFERISV